MFVGVRGHFRGRGWRWLWGYRLIAAHQCLVCADARAVPHCRHLKKRCGRYNNNFQVSIMKSIFKVQFSSYVPIKISRNLEINLKYPTIFTINSINIQTLESEQQDERHWTTQVSGNSGFIWVELRCTWEAANFQSRGRRSFIATPQAQGRAEGDVNHALSVHAHTVWRIWPNQRQ